MAQRKVLVIDAGHQAFDELDAADIPGGAGSPTDADYLVGTANAGLSAEIVVGTTPGGELGGTWASPTVDASHSGSTHAGLSGQPGSTDVAVADGGTGSSTAANARTALGLVIGTDVRAQGSGDPTVPAFATPAIVLGTAAAAGAASTVIRSDGTIAAFDATAPAAIGTAATGSQAVAARRDHVHATGAGTPSTQAMGDAAATGSGPAAAMTDHKHAMPSAALATETISFIIDGGGATITTGVKGDIVLHAAGTITEWEALADQSGSIVVDIWKDTYANFPPTVADTITGAEKPTISAATKGQDTSLNSGNGWAVTAGDVLRFNVDSITTCQRVTIALKYVKS